MALPPLPYWLLAFLCVAGSVYATEFNDAFLQLRSEHPVSLDAFNQPYSLTPGQYVVDLSLNQRFIEKLTLNFSAQPSSNHVQACLPPELLPRLGLKPEAEALLQGSSCLNISAIEGATERYLKSSSTLELSIPQAMLAYQDDNYVPPAAWNDGIPAALLDYQFSYRHQQIPQYASDTSINGYGSAGANAGPWRLRSHFNYTQQSNNHALSWNQTQLWRDIRSWHSRLSFGDLSPQSQLFTEQPSLIGVRLASDERMLPPSLRGYAPRIEGIARTNAKVTVRSKDQILYSTMVPPGPFSLQNLSSSIQGQLDVTVEEADGSVQAFTVYSASLPYLSRKGSLRYHAAIGKATHVSPGIQPTVATADASWGLTDTLSLYGGAIANPQYQALAIGSAHDLGALGALSFDITQARARLPSLASTAGRSYRFQYLKTFNHYDMTMRLGGYRFADQQFWALDDFLRYQESPEQRQRREKQRLELAIAKRLGSNSLSFSASRRQFWNHSNEQRLTFTLSRSMKIASWRNVALNLSLQQQRSAMSRQNSVSVGFSLPLEEKRHLAYNAQLTSGSPAQTLNFSDSSLGRHAYSIATSVGPQQAKPTLSGNYHYEGNQASTNLSLAQQLGGYRTLNASLSSSLLLHANGITLNKGSGGQTRLLIDAQGAKDVPLSGQFTSTDRSGYAVMTNVSPYQNQSVSINTAQLPDTVEVKHPIQRVVLTDGAVGVTRFQTDQGRRLLAILSLPSGQPLPFGATVTDPQSHQDIGLVGEKGLTYLTGITAHSALQVQWGNAQRCLVRALPADADLSHGQIPLTCHPDPQPQGNAS